MWKHDPGLHQEFLKEYFYSNYPTTQEREEIKKKNTEERANSVLFSTVYKNQT